MFEFFNEEQDSAPSTEEDVLKEKEVKEPEIINEKIEEPEEIVIKEKPVINTHKTSEKDLPTHKEENINNKGTENPAFRDHRFGQVPPIKRRSKR